ncbi:ATP-binding protein [Virgibacillus salexigens]|uniref:ATP-binding protein n=1 Tax=Virgibacillus salexigens TaxID=61016 RepID=UPI00190D914D|nr:ATP-binding protein [Virgibacillus salexigens]
MNSLEIGVVVEVNGFVSKVATFDDANHATFIYNGELIKNVSVNSFVIISQGFIKIIAKVNSESFWDNLNSAKGYNLDNRFSKNSIKRLIEIQTVGYIKNGKFISGASFLPMIGNFCNIPTNEEVNQIFINNYISEDNSFTIPIGKSLNENNDISLPVNSFFASHIGVFGNTGSGKSNTLHKLYYELFTRNELPNFTTNSSFLVLDFNGEYVHEKSFGIEKNDEINKEIYELTSRNDSSDKIPIKYDAFFDDEMLSILFSATQQTQKPFITRVLNRTKKYKSNEHSLPNWVTYLIKQIYTGIPNQNIRDLMVEILEKYFDDIEQHLINIKQTNIYAKDKKECFYLENGIEFGKGAFFDGDLNDELIEALNINNIESYISEIEIDEFQKFELRCHLQLVNDLLFGNVAQEHILPLLKRIESRFSKINNFIEIVEELPVDPFLQIISLRDLNTESKKFLSLIISKMCFDGHKSKKDKKSFHLIIDEAHNILSSQSLREQDGWMDYRLELFEEIIKEGRKFGFFLTLSSQRPSDISPTILSQVHNFFLHKLVNERDLKIIDNSISTLDRVSKSMLPVLSPGVCIISGTALTMPVSVSVDFIDNIDLRPQSDTIILTDLWK